MILTPAPIPQAGSAAFARQQTVLFFKLATKKHQLKTWRIKKCHTGPGKGISGCIFTLRTSAQTCTGDALFRVHKKQTQVLIVNLKCKP